MRLILARTLGELGFRVWEAAGARQALSILRRETTPFTLMLLDWNMPEMTGFELLKLVRGDQTLDSMVIVMVTTETELSSMSEALAAGANEYVMKPFTQEILKDKLRMVGVGL
jgi:two-component system chemotaxis response regulator CheY